VARLESYSPPWPLPKLFRMTKSGKLDTAIFEGDTINTPSMLCVEDYLDALAWAESVGGLKGLLARADANAAVLHEWMARTPWVRNLAADKATWSNTSVCMTFADPAITALPAADQAAFAKSVVVILDKEGVGLDLGAYRDAPPGLRIWTGSTVEKADVEALLPWLEWAYTEAKGKLRQAA
jgi:phosphoserine aminotransferase